MSTTINDDSMSLEIGGQVIATAEFSEEAAADGQGAWIVSSYPGRLFNRNQAITAMVLAERLATGCGEDDPFVLGWREELAALVGCQLAQSAIVTTAFSPRQPSKTSAPERSYPASGR